MGVASREHATVIVKLPPKGEGAPLTLKRAEATIIMANIAYNMGRWRWWEGRTASA